MCALSEQTAFCSFAILTSQQAGLLEPGAARLQWRLLRGATLEPVFNDKALLRRHPRPVCKFSCRISLICLSHRFFTALVAVKLKEKKKLHAGLISKRGF